MKRTLLRANKTRRAGRSRRLGASLVEAVFGFVVIIPIGLAAVDVATIISCSQTNEQLAEQSARAAACQRSQQGAQNAAEEAIEQQIPNTIIISITIDPVNWDPANGQVTVYSNMQVAVPVPLPFLNRFDLRSGAMQPIVAFPAAR